MRIRRTGRAGEAPRLHSVQAAAWPLIALMLGVGGCTKPAPVPAATTDAPAEGGPGAAPRVELGANAQIDSGNSAYKGKDYKGALAHYRAATERQPSLAAAWFGVYMAQNALGNAAGADSAMKKVQAIAPGTMGAHPARGDSGGAGMLPPGHPAAGATGAGAGAGALPPGHPTLPGSPKR